MRLFTYWGSAFLVLVAIVGVLRLIVRRDYQKRGRLTFFSSASEWILTFIWVAFSYIYLPADWPAYHVGPLLRLFGWTIVVVGMVVALLSIASLGLQRTHGLKADELMQSGPYRLTRNPQVVAFFCSMTGFVVLWPSWHMVLSLFLSFVLFHVMILTEEEHLLDRHGEEYRRYCSQVPRYTGVPSRNQVSAE